MLLNNIIALVRDAVPPNPLVNLQPILPDLTKINDFVSQFHHDTDAAVEAGQPSDAELHSFVCGALELIYRT
jgi:hypothetical protein